ncbi:hypothetical protein Tco_0517488 [Tanacetum coccineum]
MFVEGGPGNGLVGIVFFELYTKDTCPYAEEVIDRNIKVHVGGCNSNSTEEEQFRVNLVNNAIRNKGVVNPKNESNTEFFRNVHVFERSLGRYTSTLENALDFEDEVLDAEVQENEATPLSDEEITLDAAS